MTTKLAAARIATASGITVHLADGRDQRMLETMLAGGRGGSVGGAGHAPQVAGQSALIAAPCSVWLHAAARSEQKAG